MKKITIIFLSLLVFTSAWAGTVNVVVGQAYYDPYPDATAKGYADSYQSRVVADGGTIISYSDVYYAYKMLVDNSLYSYCKLWCSARFGVKKDGSGYITKIYDISSNQYDGTGAGATKPQWLSSTQNSKPGILFTAANDTADASNFAHGNTSFLNGANSGFLIINGSASLYNYAKALAWGSHPAPSGWTSPYLLVDANGSNYYRMYSSNAATTTYNLLASSVSAASTTYYNLNWKMSSAWKINDMGINATSIGSATANTLTPSGAATLYIGCETPYPTSNQPTGWPGHINEYLFLNKEYSAGEYTAIMAYLNGIWATY